MAYEPLPHALCARPPDLCAFSYHTKELEKHWKTWEDLKNLHETVVEKLLFYFFFFKSSRTSENKLFKYLFIHPDTCETQYRSTGHRLQLTQTHTDSYSTGDKDTDTRDWVDTVTTY